VDSLRATCGRVLANAQHQERLIEAMLTLARSQRGLDERRPLDVAIVTAEYVEALGAGPAACGLRLDCDLHPAAASGDDYLIGRLVANLVDNALRYNVPGGWVRLSTGTEGERAVLRVANSGPVVAASQIDTLLQPFCRLSPRDGLGLGLSIVAAIVAAHRAVFRAVPGPDGGMEVTIVFAPPEPEGRPLLPTHCAKR
jgi:signal transduction histidine kinase